MSKFNTIQENIRQMEGGKFQKLCDVYLYKKMGWNIEACGSMQGTNKTTAGTPDSYCRLNNGKYILIMYGTRKEQYKKIQSDINDAKSKSGLKLDKIETIVCCYSGTNLTAKEHNELNEIAKPCKLELIGGTTLAAELSQKYLSVAKEFMKLPGMNDQVVSPTKFVNKYDSIKYNANLDTEYIRSDNYDDVMNSITSHQITLLYGDPGIGKTKTSVEVMKKLDNDGDICLCINNKKLPIYEEIEQNISANKNNYILVDDINDFSNNNVESMLSLLSDYNNVHFLITLRKYLLNETEKMVDKYDYHKILLSQLNDQGIDKILAEKQYLPNNKMLRDNIIKICHENPRCAIIAAKYVKENPHIKLDTIEDIMVKYYRDALSSVDIKDNDYIHTLFIISVYRKINLKNLDSIKIILDALNLSNERFKKCVNELFNKEFCDVTLSCLVEIKDQALMDYCLYNVLFEEVPNQFDSLFSAIYKIGPAFLVQAINGAESIKFTQSDKDNLSKVINDYFDEHDFSKDEKIQFLKLFGACLPLQVIEEANKIVKNFSDDVSGNDYNNFEELIMNLFPLNTEDYYFNVIIKLCMDLIKKNKQCVNKIINLFTNYMGLDLRYQDKFHNIKNEIIIFKDYLASNNKNENIDNFIFEIIKRFLNFDFTLNQWSDKRTISLCNIEINDDNFNSEVVDDLFDIMLTLLKRNEELIIPFLKLVKNICKRYRDNDKQELLKIYFSKFMMISENINNNIYLRKIVEVHILHEKYLCSILNRSSVEKKMDTFQEVYWELHNFYSKNIFSEPSSRSIRYLYNIIVSKKIDFKTLVDYILICLHYDDSRDRDILNFVLDKNINNMDKLKKTMISELIQKHIEKYDFHLLELLINMYGGNNFYNDFESEYEGNYKVEYLIYSHITNPSDDDVSTMYKIMSNLQKQDWFIVKFNDLNEKYQEGTAEVFLKNCVNNNHEYYSKETLKNFFDHVNDRNLLYSFYLNGMACGIDGIDNEHYLFDLLVQYESFQKSFVEFIFKNKNGFGLINSDLSYQIKRLFNCNYFKTLLVEKLNPIDCLNYNWGIILNERIQESKRWLFSYFKKLNNKDEMNDVLNLFNMYFIDDEIMIDVYQCIQNKSISLEGMDLLPRVQSWGGSEIPLIEKNINYLRKKIEPIFEKSSVENYITIQEKVKSLVEYKNVVQIREALEEALE